jgi:hypothetical protein
MFCEQKIFNQWTKMPILEPQKHKEKNQQEKNTYS